MTRTGCICMIAVMALAAFGILFGRVQGKDKPLRPSGTSPCREAQLFRQNRQKRALIFYFCFLFFLYFDNFLMYYIPVRRGRPLDGRNLRKRIYGKGEILWHSITANALKRSPPT